MKQGDLFEHELPADCPAVVAARYEQVALDLARRRELMSSHGVLIILRYKHAMDEWKEGPDRRPFKCNNNWSRGLAMWWMSRHPEYPGYFKLRERRG